MNLYLLDGTIIRDLELIGRNKFQVKNIENNLYHLLNDNNLSLAFLDEDNILMDIYIDFALQNYFFDNGYVQFKINPWEEVYREPNSSKRKRRKKKWD